MPDVSEVASLTNCRLLEFKDEASMQSGSYVNLTDFSANKGTPSESFFCLNQGKSPNAILFLPTAFKY
jgi:hypothetical protein